MEGGPLAMSQKERGRLVMMSRVEEETMTIKEAAEVMGISYRQGRRIYRRYVIEGDKGLVHRNRGRPSNRRKPSKLREVVLEPCIGNDTGILGPHWQQRSSQN